mmetsp:Transcript_61603/g.137265  ORF Transcript_61603/g.137265 Transcript_61603/m.137265 type:complete len:227 (+) Transcript_61603:3-683(+)
MARLPSAAAAAAALSDDAPKCRKSMSSGIAPALRSTSWLKGDTARLRTTPTAAADTAESRPSLSSWMMASVKPPTRSTSFILCERARLRKASSATRVISSCSSSDVVVCASTISLSGGMAPASARVSRYESWVARRATVAVALYCTAGEPTPTCERCTTHGRKPRREMALKCLPSAIEYSSVTTPRKVSSVFSSRISWRLSRLLVRWRMSVENRSSCSSTSRVDPR